MSIKRHKLINLRLSEIISRKQLISLSFPKWSIYVLDYAELAVLIVIAVAMLQFNDNL